MGGGVVTEAKFSSTLATGLAFLESKMAAKMSAVLGKIRGPFGLYKSKIYATSVKNKNIIQISELSTKQC